MKINRDPILPALIEDQFSLPETVLFDVGCSGGITPDWSPLKPVSHGFDCLVNEVERLAKADPETTFTAAKVTGPLSTNRVDTWFRHASCWPAIETLNRDYTRDVFNSGAPVVFADKEITLDEYARVSGAYPNLIKSDTDGGDYAVLSGASECLKTCLAVQVEANFQAFGEHTSVFRDIDRLMVEAGFMIGDMKLARYSRAELPARFVGGFVADTDSGAIAWADVFYLRDPNTLTDRDDLLRLAMVCEIASLPDLAAAALAKLPGAEPLLDALVRYSPFPDEPSYAALLERFNSDPRAFMA